MQPASVSQDESPPNRRATVKMVLPMVGLHGKWDCHFCRRRNMARHSPELGPRCGLRTWRCGSPLRRDRFPPERAAGDVGVEAERIWRWASISSVSAAPVRKAPAHSVTRSQPAPRWQEINAVGERTTKSVAPTASMTRNAMREPSAPGHDIEIDDRPVDAALGVVATSAGKRKGRVRVKWTSPALPMSALCPFPSSTASVRSMSRNAENGPSRSTRARRCANEVIEARILRRNGDLGRLAAAVLPAHAAVASKRMTRIRQVEQRAGLQASRARTRGPISTSARCV